MAEKIIEFLLNAFNGNTILPILIIAMIPLIELRGSIPIAIQMGFSFGSALFWAWLGTTLVVPLLLLLLRPVLNWAKNFRWMKAFALSIENLFSTKANRIEINAKNREMRKLFGLFCFVAIPMPMTGAWSGSAIACFLNVPYWKSLCVIAIGNLVASVIMTTLSFYLAKYINFILGGLFIAIAIVIIAYVVKAIYDKKKRKNEIDINYETNILDED